MQTDCVMVPLVGFVRRGKTGEVLALGEEKACVFQMYRIPLSGTTRAPEQTASCRITEMDDLIVYSTWHFRSLEGIIRWTGGYSSPDGLVLILLGWLASHDRQSRVDGSYNRMMIGLYYEEVR